MKTKIINYWEYLRSSFWFIPAGMVVAAMILAYGMVSADRFISVSTFGLTDVFFTMAAEGARSILSTIAGSVMTVAGVSFSITIVTLNLASSQFGPRLIRNFMQDKSTQAVLGTFVASFIYCLLVLCSVQTVESNLFVPNLSVIFAVLLALLNVAVLIFFIHHVATSIQADKVVSGISKELQANIKRLFTSELAFKQPDDPSEVSEPEGKGKSHQYDHPITARYSGYLQAIDLDTLLKSAIANDYCIQIQLRAGHFVVANSLLAIVSSAKRFDQNLSDKITDAFIVGDQRTSEQDAEYSIHQLVEVAVRALSPGINDPYTAIACIDQLGAVLGYVANMRFPPACCLDDRKTPRLFTKPLTYSGMLNASFDKIRQHGRTSVSVTLRLLEVLTILGQLSRSADQRKAIQRQADMVLRSSQEAFHERNDKADVRDRYQRLISTLNEFKDIADADENTGNAPRSGLKSKPS